MVKESVSNLARPSTKRRRFQLIEKVANSCSRKNAMKIIIWSQVVFSLAGSFVLFGQRLTVCHGFEIGSFQNTLHNGNRRRLSSSFYYVAASPRSHIQGGILDKNDNAVWCTPASSSLKMTKSSTGSKSEDVRHILMECATARSVASTDVVQTLEALLLASSTTTPTASTKLKEEQISLDFVNGVFELIFSSAVADLPLGIGGLLDGYLPNKEIVTFDFVESQKMSLSVETFPFLPTIDIVGDNLSWNESTNTLRYTVSGKDKASEWKILYADENIVAGKSSVTGLNVLRRV